MSIFFFCVLQAVCCADQEHCCPQGYSCNMQTGTCEKKNHDVLILTLPQSKVVQSEPRHPEDDANVPCDSTGEFHCPKQDTCCKVSNSAWACCPSARVRSHCTHMCTAHFLRMKNVLSEHAFIVGPRLVRASGVWIMWPVNIGPHYLENLCSFPVFCLVKHAVSHVFVLVCSNLHITVGEQCVLHMHGGKLAATFFIIIKNIML